MDIMDIEILKDGTIKFTTDKISQANHQNADDFLQLVEEMTSDKIIKQNPKHQHTHKHQHQHTHKL